MGKKQKTKLQKHQSLYYIHGVTTDIVDINIIIRSNSMLRKHTEKRKKTTTLQILKESERYSPAEWERERWTCCWCWDENTSTKAINVSHTFKKLWLSERHVLQKQWMLSKYRPDTPYVWTRICVWKQAFTESGVYVEHTEWLHVIQTTTLAVSANQLLKTLHSCWFLTSHQSMSESLLPYWTFCRCHWFVRWWFLFLTQHSTSFNRNQT